MDLFVKDVDNWIEENIVNDKISKERAIDPDLWVLELETDTFGILLRKFKC